MAVNDEIASSDSRALRRLFISVQISKAVLGAVLGLAFVSYVGRPDAAEAIAIAGLMAPALLALLAFTAIPLAWLEQRALAIFAVLIGYLAALTGGVLSPLVVWFALVPAEAALAGGAARRAARRGRRGDRAHRRRHDRGGGARSPSRACRFRCGRSMRSRCSPR